MNSLGGLVDRTCGDANPLVSLTRTLAREGASSSKLTPTGARASLADEFAHEYLAELAAKQRLPQTFSMHSLMESINGIAPGELKWTNEFLRMNPQNEAPMGEWSTEYLERFEASSSEQMAVVPRNPERELESAWSEACAAPLKWSAEYLEDAAEGSISDLLRSAPNDPQLWNTEFMRYVQGESETGNTLKQEDRTDFWNQLESQWDSMAKGSTYSWLDEYESLDNRYNNYEFAAQNPYGEEHNALEEGKRHLREGQLASAILLFESAVSKDLASAEAWQYLGVAQAENEQEPSAIAALKKCLEQAPENLQALAALAVSYTNESLYADAAYTLRQWLGAHPRYRDMVPAEAQATQKRVSSFLDPETFREIEGLFLQAVRRERGEVDPDLQNSLGVLYNMSGEYDRAVDCFKTALNVKPQDARLWNRLGATLANGNRSADAVSAYYTALEHYPGFVRSRYNLGIACMNLRSHKEAVEHFLSALTLQQQGIGPSSQGQMSNSIWNSMRMSMSQLGRMDLFEMVDQRDLAGLGRELGARNQDQGESNMVLDFEVR